MAWKRGALVVAWGSALGSLAFTPALVAAPPWVLAIPWLASTALLGLPHGAADPFVPLGWPRSERAWIRVGLFSAAYLAVAAVYAGIWLAAPVASAVGFLMLTWAHWGQGDVFALRAMGWDAHLPSAPLRVFAAVVRGALPMAVPLAAFPADYAAVVGAMAEAVRPESAGRAEALILAVPPGDVWILLAALWIVYALAGGWAARRRGAWQSWRRDHAEVALLAIFFGFVPPLWSVGVYFCLWHALRHLGRLAPLVAGGSARQLALLCLPGTAGALALIGILLTRPLGGDAIGSAGAYLVGIAALTVPHVLVVAWMDARQRVWTAPSAAEPASGV
jgi:Brp/Blh family beta-carotene 15,15'-monooxygenase